LQYSATVFGFDVNVNFSSQPVDFVHTMDFVDLARQL